MANIETSGASATHLRYRRLFGDSYFDTMRRVQVTSRGLRRALRAIQVNAERFEAACLVAAIGVKGVEQESLGEYRLEALDADRHGAELSRGLERASIELYVGGRDWESAERVQAEVIDAEQQVVRVAVGEFLAGEIRIRRDVNQLRRMRGALFDLQNSPSTDDKPLLRLFDEPSTSLWPPVNLSEPEPVWFQLNDNERSGIEQQREFVRLVLDGPDITLLEGPPGSGKTTVIVEAIVQAVRSGRRVLLCAPTHVAVDNALERLEASGALESEGILAIRVASGNRGLESTRHLSEDYILKNFRSRVSSHLGRLSEDNLSESQRLLKELAGGDLLEEILVDAANLVAGTTIGIVSHRQFRGDASSRRRQKFDHMILDEASKATLPEAIVPAIRARKWTFCGDIRQLSPTSVDDAAPILRSEVLAGCEKLRSGIDPSMLFAAMVDAAKLIRDTSVELLYEKADGSDVYEMELHAIAAGVGQPGLIDRCTVVQSIDEFKQVAQSQIVRRLGSVQLEEIVEEWSNELGWRLATEYSLRQLDERERGTLTGQISAMTNSTVSELRDLIEMAVQLVSGVCLASILESIQVGIGRRSFHNPSVISDGLPASSLADRRVSLQFQHRMHPQISAFPRECFYEGRLLHDASGMAERRNWSFDRYLARSVWLDVRSSDPSEVNDVVNRELTALEQWAASSTSGISAALISPYSAQVKHLRKLLRNLSGDKDGFTRFSLAEGRIDLHLGTIDSFQGQEADIVFLVIGMDRATYFTKSPNRINVALTRAKEQLVVIGNHERFAEGPLASLAASTRVERRWGQP